ncbi:MAG: glycosyltransferase family 4 protein, partial [Fidelibacterota bacterium]
EKADIVYATSTPLTIGIPAVFCKMIKHIPFIFEVRDEWPRIPVEMGILKSKVLVAFLYGLEKCIYRNAAGIVALSPGMKKNILKYTNTDTPIIVAPNSADLTLFNPAINPQELRHRLDLEGKFVLIHFGTIGHVNGLNFIVDISKKIEQYSDIIFLIIGDGSERPELLNRIRRENISNVKIIPPVSKMKLPYYVAIADVALVLFNNYPILENNSANKFFDSLSAGKPILLNYSGWQRRVVEDYNAGLGTDLWDMGQFEKNIHRLYNDPALRVKMGKNARMLAEKEFDRDKISLNILQFIIKIAG